MRRLLASVDAPPSVRVATDGRSAIEAICDEHPPDIVFLDVQMPGGDGFSVVERVGPDSMPVTVFVTAFDQFATRAFEVQALDYLVKPYEDRRFIAAFERARRRVSDERFTLLGARLHHLLDTVRGGRPSVETLPLPEATPELEGGILRRIAVRSGERVHLLRASEIDRVIAEGVYARVFAGAQSHLLRMSMNEMEVRLDPATFLRVHRSAIVNMERIRELRDAGRGDYAIILDSGASVKLSRSRRTAFERRIGQSL